MIDRYDKEKRRCPMLGHQIAFQYCRSCNRELPCSKIYDCWFQTIPIQQYMQEHFDNNVLKRISAPTKPKMLSLLELIDKARSNMEEGKG